MPLPHKPKVKKKVPPVWVQLRQGWKPYKFLSGYMKPYLPKYICGLVCGAISGAVSSMLPAVTLYAFSHIDPSITGRPSLNMLKKMHGAHGPAFHPTLSVWLACAAIPAVMIVNSLFDFLDGYLCSWVSMKVLSDIKVKLFGSILGQSMDFFNKSRSGNLISRVANDTRMAQQALATLSVDAVKQPIIIVGVTATLFAIDWRFTLGAMILFPLFMLPVLYFGTRSRMAGRAEEDEQGMITVILQESFAGIKVIKSFAREERTQVEFEGSSLRQFGVAMQVRRAIELVGPLVEGMASIGVGLALLYVYWAGLPTYKLLGLLVAMPLLYPPIKTLSRIHLLLQKCLAATTGIMEMMNQAPTIQDLPDAKVLQDCHGKLEFKNVTFAYGPGRVPAVSGLSLVVSPGKTYALVGESGAGKSTMLGLILRFYDPVSGAIEVDGQDLRTITQKSLRENIGIVSQDTFLFHESIFRNIQYGRPDATREEVIEAAKKAYAHDFILAQEHGYDTVIGDKGCRISGGQQQRLAIARAILKNAPILLLDEATSALDSQSEQKIKDALDSFSEGRTVIAIAHRLSTILRSDQIVVMDEGHVREVGSHHQLLEESVLYRRLYELQFKQFEEPAALEPAGMAQGDFEVFRG